jgi:tryptophan synthase beta subunit
MSTSLSQSKARGYFGDFGGAYLPEILVATFRDLEAAFAEAQADPAFWANTKPSWANTRAGRRRSPSPRI